MEYKNFTSLPPEEEQAFVVYERTSREAGTKALIFGAISGLIVGVFVIGLYITMDPPVDVHAAEPVSELKEQKRRPNKTAPKVEAAVEVAPEAAAGTPATTAPATTAPATTAPTPPKGATKAPPTALIKE